MFYWLKEEQMPSVEGSTSSCTCVSEIEAGDRSFEPRS